MASESSVDLPLISMIEFMSLKEQVHSRGRGKDEEVERRSYE